MELSRFLRLISGHNGLFYFKHKIDPEKNAVCRFCLAEDETFHHLITNCPAYFLSRKEIFLENAIDENNKWSVRNMLIFSYLPGVREAIDGDTNLELFAYMDGSAEDDDEDEFDPP